MDVDLFVVNRHGDDENQVEISIDDKEANLASIQTRIEKNRKKAQKKREKAKEKRANELKQKKMIWTVMERRTHEKRFKYVQPETNSEFIDETLNAYAMKLEAEEAGAAIKIGDKPDKEEEKGAKKSKKKHRKTDAVPGFTVLGPNSVGKQSKVKSVLPDWLEHPTIISVDLQNLQTKLSSVKCLDKQLRNKLKDENIKYLFPVQSQVVPYLINSYNMRNCMAPRDICVSAPTGSGKTLAFVLPIIQALQNKFVRKIRALVILPTHDLAIQVFKTFKKYAADTKLKVFLVTGGTAFLEEQHYLVYQNVVFGPGSKVDILIGTAGRLVDHIKQTPGFTLEHLEFLVIDEADRVLDNVQNDWLYHLEKHIYKDEPVDLTELTICNYGSRRAPQKLLFSATLTQDPEKLHQLGLYQPKLFTSVIEAVDENMDASEKFVPTYTTPKELTEKYIMTSIDLKPLVLYEFIKNEKLSRILVFTHSTESAHRLKILLQSLFGDEKKIFDISSTLSNYARNNLIERFSKGKIDIFICTDGLARGIDIPNVQCVISYSAPKHLQTYIHRVGRTARAGESGLAVTMLIQAQFSKFCGMLSDNTEKTALKEIKIDETQLESLAEKYQASLKELKTTIQEEGVQKNKKVFAARRGTHTKNENT